MPTDNLSITEVAQSQANKVLTINEAFNDLDNATQRKTTVTLTGNLTLDADLFKRNILFRFDGNLAAAATVTIPDTARLFAVQNVTGQSITITNGSFSVMISDTGQALLHMDDSGVTQLGGVTSGGGGAGVSTASLIAAIHGNPSDEQLIVYDSTNSRFYFGNVRRSITRTAFDALSQTQKDNGTMYLIDETQ